MSDAVGALFAGLLKTLRAPLLLIVVLAITLATAVPFAWMVGRGLQTALAHQPPIDLDATEIDAEWWMAYRDQARGLDATFTPAIIGFAAPLDNLSALLDATSRPIALLWPVLLYGLVWAFMWGGVIHRFALPPGQSSAREFFRAAVRHLPGFAAVSVAAALVTLALYFTVHPLLFGVVYNALAGQISSEPGAFIVRVALYLVFGALLALVMLAADYTRVASVVANLRLRPAVARAWGFIRTNAGAVTTLYVLNALLVALVLSAYGIADRRGGGWQTVFLGQAYIVARLGMRLAAAASEVVLFQKRPL